MGYGDRSVHGHPLIETPHIDALETCGQRWTLFYAAIPLCMQSRIALMTGRMQMRIHGDGRNRLPNLPAQELTLGQLLKRAGYIAAYVDKWGMFGRFTVLRHRECRCPIGCLSPLCRRRPATTCPQRNTQKKLKGVPTNTASCVSLSSSSQVSLTPALKPLLEAIK